MPEPWIDIEQLGQSLKDFFEDNRNSVSGYGSTVNQVFEAFVFASVVQWYKNNNWNVSLCHPKPSLPTSQACVRLKFSTRGRPEKYTFAECRKGHQKLQVRHQLRVATSWHSDTDHPPANICLDIAVIKPTDMQQVHTNDAIPSQNLITFGEAKHMSAFAELIASFEGLVHEMQPSRLTNVRTTSRMKKSHPSPFLYVSGNLYFSAEGIVNTIKRRGYDIDVYTSTSALSEGVALSVTYRTRKRPISSKRGLPATNISTDDLPF